MHMHRLPFLLTFRLLSESLIFEAEPEWKKGRQPELPFQKHCWLGGRDSNPDRRIQSPQSYR